MNVTLLASSSAEPCRREDVQQPERDAEGGQRAPQRVVRGRAHLSEDGLPLRSHGDHRQGGGQSVANLHSSVQIKFLSREIRQLQSIRDPKSFNLRCILQNS